MEITKLFMLDYITMEKVSKTFILGLVSSGFLITGDIVISAELTVKSDLNGANPLFTLTCISTGGPATTVTWIRDSELVTQGAKTVLANSSTSRYIHSLIVTTEGDYSCSVTNTKPSSATASLTVKGIIIIANYSYTLCLIVDVVASPPTDVIAVQDGPSSIRVTWTPPSPLGDTTGYRISFTGGGSSDSVDIRGGNTNTFLVTGLVKEVTYNVSIVGTSQHLPSTTVPVPGSVILGELAKDVPKN